MSRIVEAAGRAAGASNRRAVPRPAPAAPKPTATPDEAGIATAHGHASGSRSKAEAIETAMSQAILDARAEGITDPAVIRERMMMARDKAKAPSP